MMTRTEQLADAYHAVARVNHYMVGVVDDKVTDDEIDGAEQILITRQNALAVKAGKTYKVLDLALDLIEAERKERLRA